jgi:hypothetical protein
VVTAELGFFAPPDRVAEELVYLAGVHGVILKLFDECFEGALVADPEWRTLAERLALRQRMYTDRVLARPADPD